MTTNKKLVVTVGVMAVALVLALTGIIVVLVTANQRASSAVNVKYTSSDVAVTLSATAYLGGNSHAFTKGGVVGGETELVLSPTVTEGSLSQTSDIASFDLTKTNTYVVFEYVFQNKTGNIDVKIDQDGVPATRENINLTYTYSDTPIQYSSFKTLEGETEFAAQLLPAYAGEETVKYVYIKAQIADLLYDSSLVGDFGWALSKPSEDNVNTVTLSLSGADLVERTGSNLSSTTVTSNYAYKTFATTVDTEDISVVPAVANKAFVGWSETEGGTVISTIDMPNTDATHNTLRGTTATTLYPVYKDGNVNMTTTASGATVTGLADTSATELVIPDITIHEGAIVKVTTIGDEAFYGFGFTSVIIGNKVTSIGSSAFKDIGVIANITIPNSVTSIGDNAFYWCYTTSLTIPSSVTSIGTSVFGGVDTLTNVVVEAGNPVYDSRDNCNAIIETASNKLIFGCNTTLIPDSVTSIGDNAFLGNTGLTSITIPSSVTSIGSYAFHMCTNLTSVTIENGVIRIEMGAFEGAGLTSLILPSSVTFIGTCAFVGCTGLLSSNGGTGITFEDTAGWSITGTDVDVTRPNNNAINLVDSIWQYYDLEKNN